MNRSILMLEHDDDDRYITQAVLDDLKAQVNISYVANSTDFFSRLEKSKPDLVLITYRASPLNGVEVLKKLRSIPAFKSTPAIVLSGVSSEIIVRECYNAGATSFITKPSSDKETTVKIARFLDYWFKTVELP
ncbi:MAG TPA: response regulator [Chryseosolibacter sp.]